MSKQILSVTYVIDDDSMTDAEFEGQPERTIIITESMIRDLVEQEDITIKPGQTVNPDNFFITKL